MSAPSGKESGGGAILDPVERLSEVLFGLIMALTFTGSISAASDGHEEIKTMLYGAIGCNLAWGIVDAVMYLLTAITVRGRAIRTIHALRKIADPTEARRVIGEALPPVVASVLAPEHYQHLHQQLGGLENIPDRARLNGSDLRGAFGVFLLVFISTFPLVIPFLFMNDPVRALRTSHAIAITLLFFVGHSLGRFSGQGGWRMGLSMVGIGLTLVALTIALGG